ncbi:hypothetical protein NL676_013602 [Syzygium grande]|nr:hypothetical protein NL676_013602 [Syzygium grande]
MLQWWWCSAAVLVLVRSCLGTMVQALRSKLTKGVARLLRQEAQHGWTQSSAAQDSSKEQQDSNSDEACGVISTNSRASQLGWCNVGGVWTTSQATTSLEDGQQSSNIGIGCEEGLGQEGLS